MDEELYIQLSVVHKGFLSDLAAGTAYVESFLKNKSPGNFEQKPGFICPNHLYCHTTIS